MALYNTLLESTPKVSPKTPDSVREPRVSGLDLNYDPKTERLTYSARVHSNSTPSNYDVLIEFSDVKQNQGLTEEEIQQGFQPKPSLNNNEVKVFCNCTNYRFRFDEPNRSNGVGTGPAFPTYVRKTNRAPNNPAQLPGVCSHIIELMNYLVTQVFITD